MDLLSLGGFKSAGGLQLCARNGMNFDDIFVSSPLRPTLALLFYNLASLLVAHDLTPTVISVSLLLTAPLQQYNTLITRQGSKRPIITIPSIVSLYILSRGPTSMSSKMCCTFFDYTESSIRDVIHCWDVYISIIEFFASGYKNWAQKLGM